MEVRVFDDEVSMLEDSSCSVSDTPKILTTNVSEVGLPVFFQYRVNTSAEASTSIVFEHEDWNGELETEV